jgi:hypothetical protein
MNTEEIKDELFKWSYGHTKEEVIDKAFNLGVGEGKKLKNGHDDIINLFGEKREKLGYNKACGDCLKEFADIEHLLCDCPYDQEDNSNHTDECEVTLFRQKIRKLQVGFKQ